MDGGGVGVESLSSKKKGGGVGKIPSNQAQIN